MSGSFSVRQAQEEDLDAVVQLDRVTSEAPHWSEDVYREMLAYKMPTDVKAPFSPVQRVLFVAVTKEGLCGFAAAGGSVDGADLESIVVAGRQRRRGVARALMAGLMSWASAAGMGDVWRLEVRERNVAARELYSALGFCECGRRRAYYREPLEDAILMQRTA